MLFMLTLTPSPHMLWEPFKFLGEINLIPFVETVTVLMTYAEHGMWFALIANLGGNIAVFLPAGFFAGLFSEKPRWWKAVLCSFALSLFIELGQIFVWRGTDVDDLILNTIGGLLGYGVFCLIIQAWPTLVQKCRKSL